jgi:hypothetical protein
MVTTNKSPQASDDKPSLLRQRVGSMSLEERSYWLNRLVTLSDRSSRDVFIWKSEIQAALGANPIFNGFFQEIDKINPAEKAQEGMSLQADRDFERKIQQQLDGALRVVANSPISFDDTLRAQIESKVHEDIWSSSTVKIARWLSTLAIFGGTIWGIWKFQGLVTLANETAANAVAQIQAAQQDVNNRKAEVDGLASNIKSTGTQAEETAARIKNRSDQIANLINSV